MRWVIVFLFLIFFVTKDSISQSKPQSISIGSTFCNDLDNFEWYKNYPYVSTLSYGYSFKDMKNHLFFSLSNVYSKVNYLLVPSNFDLFEVYEKNLVFLNIQYKRSYFQSKHINLQAKGGFIGRYGFGVYDTYRGAFDSEGRSISYDSFGASIGHETLVYLPYNFFVSASADYAYYFLVFKDEVSNSYGVFAPRNSFYLSLNLGYQFGGKKRNNKQFK
ncbi:MAG: hypothetical protein ACPGD5_10845 [Salibacteraceae bacterium]